jgi:hypothetical protein
VRLGEHGCGSRSSLTDAETGTCRWAERYDRQVEDLFDVLDDITDVIVATIEPEVGYAERERVARRPRTDLRAWDLYHLGIAHFYRFTARTTSRRSGSSTRPADSTRTSLTRTPGGRTPSCSA